MSKKEKVSLRRSEDFESVDDALTAAMLRLDATNERVGQLLSGDAARAGQLPGMPDEQPEPTDTPRLGGAARKAEAAPSADA
jgi:hypothetical protein